MADLPGQMVMPFAADTADAGPDGDAAIEALRAGLPAKQTLTLAEAACWLGMSRRQVEYLVADGTLMALYAGRDPNPERRHARPVVRLQRTYDPARRKSLTAEELCVRNSNVMQG